MILYRAIAFLLWFGVMMVLATVALAAALVAVIGAVAFGFASPSRTPKSCLRSLAFNAREGIARVRALR